MMINHLIAFVISVFSLFTAFFWFNVLYFTEPNKRKRLENPPLVSIIIPAYNEEEGIEKTIKSLLNSTYPREKLNVIVVDDCSTDKTLELAKMYPITVLHNEVNRGKGYSINRGLNVAEGEIVGVVDADSSVNPEAIIRMVEHFEDKEIKSVVSAMKVDNPKNILEKIQKLEYVLGILMRKLLGNIGCLFLLHGGLTMYRTKLLKEIGGFDEHTITEDFEMGMRLLSKNYKVIAEDNAISYTSVPKNLKSLWSQRIRWYRGQIMHSIQYREMLLNKKYGMMGLFQFPINILFPISLMLALFLMVYSLLSAFYGNAVGVETVGIGFLLSSINIKMFLYTLNYQLIIIIISLLLLSIYFLYKAYHISNESIWAPGSLFLFIFVYPYLIVTHWFGAIYKEIRREKRKW